MIEITHADDLTARAWGITSLRWEVGDWCKENLGYTPEHVRTAMTVHLAFQSPTDETLFRIRYASEILRSRKPD